MEVERRSDGRQSLELRPLELAQSLISRADGSSRLAFGDSAVLACVHGPSTVRARHEEIEAATLSVHVQPYSSAPNTRQTSQSVQIYQAICDALFLAMHPHSLVQVIIQPMHDDGSMLSLAINASLLALIDAAFPLRTTVVAVQVALTEEDVLLVDPSGAEEKTAKASVLMVFEMGQDSPKLAAVDTTGRFSFEQLGECIAVGSAAAAKIHSFMVTAISKRLESSQS